LNAKAERLAESQAGLEKIVEAKGSISIQFACFSVPPRAGRGRCLARPAS
jgi:hypothetical protein